MRVRVGVVASSVEKPKALGFLNTVDPRGLAAAEPPTLRPRGG